MAGSGQDGDQRANSPVRRNIPRIMYIALDLSVGSCFAVALPLTVFVLST